MKLLFEEGNSQAKVLLEDDTLESFSYIENTKGEAGDGESLRFKDREGAMVHLLCPFLFYRSIPMSFKRHHAD